MLLRENEYSKLLCLRYIGQSLAETKLEVEQIAYGENVQTFTR